MLAAYIKYHIIVYINVFQEVNWEFNVAVVEEQPHRPK